MIALLLLLAAPADAGPGWRQVVTSDDRRRLRRWRDAWDEALAAARAGGGAAAIAADPVLFDPDAARTFVMPPPGSYRCRTVKLGSRGAGLSYVAYPFFTCRVGADGRFTKVDGSQRPVGRIHRVDGTRAVFLGTLALGDERRALPYGRDRLRDLAARVERIGSRRWRLVFPYPHYESLLDLIELVPDAASVGTTGGGTTAGTGATAARGSEGSEAR